MVNSKQKKTSLVSRLWKHKILFLMVSPAIIFFFIFSYMTLPGLYLAFIDFKYAQGILKSPFVGLKNFEFLFNSGQLWMITKHSILYNLAFLIFGNILQIIVAILLNEVRSKNFKKVTQTLLFLPYFISAVVIGLLAYNILNFDYGFLNNLLKSLNLEPIAVYSSPKPWPVIIIFANLWQGIGYGSIIYFAAITGIDSEIIEASQIDGANGLQKIMSIILPCLKPTMIILFLFAIGGILKGNFGLFYNLVGNNSTLFPSTDIIETYVYRAMMVNFNFSMGSAVGFYQSIFGFAVVMIANSVVKKIESDYSLF